MAGSAALDGRRLAHLCDNDLGEPERDHVLPQPAMAIRTPTLNVLSRRITKYPAKAGTTFWRANTSSANTYPIPVVMVVKSSNQIDATPNTIK